MLSDMKVSFRKKGGLLNAQLDCEIDCNNVQQLTQEESRELVALLNKYRPACACTDESISGQRNEFSYQISIDDGENRLKLAFCTGMYLEDIELWRSVELIETLCYRACGAEQRPISIGCCPRSNVEG